MVHIYFIIIIYLDLKKSIFMNEARLKRKIDLRNISAITVSKFGPEFVIHVAKEYDYRFCSKNDKLLILSVLTKTIL